MIFFSKTPDTKEGQLKARQERDRRAMQHQEHLGKSEAAAEQAQGAMGTAESPNASEGLNEDLASKIGEMAHEIKSDSSKRANSIMRMRGRVRAGRKRLKKKARSLGV